MTVPKTYTTSDSDRVRRFVVEGDAAFAPSGSHRYATLQDARGVPVAEAVLAVPGVQEIAVEGNAVTVLRRESFSWEDVQDRVTYAISTAVQSAKAQPATEGAVGGPLTDDQIYEVVERVLRRDINPAVAGHGGAVELLDVQDAVVVLRMMGGCQGCGMANVTLRQGIEGHLRRVIPNLGGIRDITDHASGTNPYFQ